MAENLYGGTPYVEPDRPEPVNLYGGTFVGYGTEPEQKRVQPVNLYGGTFVGYGPEPEEPSTPLFSQKGIEGLMDAGTQVATDMGRGAAAWRERVTTSPFIKGEDSLTPYESRSKAAIETADALIPPREPGKVGQEYLKNAAEFSKEHIEPVTDVIGGTWNNALANMFSSVNSEEADAALRADGLAGLKKLLGGSPEESSQVGASVLDLLTPLAGIATGAGVGVGAAKLARLAIDKSKGRWTLMASAPSIKQVKDAEQGLYNDLIQAKAVSKDTGSDLYEASNVAARGARVDPQEMPIIQDLMVDIKHWNSAGSRPTLKVVNELRQRAYDLSISTNPRVAKPGVAILDAIDKFTDEMEVSFSKSDTSDLQSKFKAARKLNRRVRKAELLNRINTEADFKKLGLENALREKYQKVWDNPGQRALFNSKEKKLIKELLDRETNVAKWFKDYGYSKDEVSKVLAWSIISAGTAVGLGGAGFSGSAITVAAIQGIKLVAKEAAKAITKRGHRYENALARAGNKGPEIIKVYNQNTPRHLRNDSDLAVFLLKPDIDLTDIPNKYAEAANLALYRRAQIAGAIMGAGGAGAVLSTSQDKN